MESLEDMDSQWKYWKKLFREFVDSHILLKKAWVRRKILLWITQEVRALMRARSYYCTKAKKSGKVEDLEQYKRLRNQVAWSKGKFNGRSLGKIRTKSSRDRSFGMVV